jgi:hypothetical protein
MAGKLIQCEFFLLRYVPDAVREDSVTVGVILRRTGATLEKGQIGPGAVVKFTSDWRRVRCLDPDADIATLEGIESELRRRFAAEPDGNLFHVLEDSFSNCLRMTAGQARLVESAEAGVEDLMRMYVDPPKRERVSRLSGRAAIQMQMRNEFERVGVWDLLRKRIDAAQYTRVGDPLRIDCGYRVSGAEGGLIRMFQAVSLDAGVDMAKVLAFSAAGLIAGVGRVEGAGLELTAVVEPVRQGSGIRVQETEIDGAGIGFDVERLGVYRYAVETMEEHKIRVVTTADLARVAETARREIGV